MFKTINRYGILETRKPKLRRRLPGGFGFRAAERQYSERPAQEPPRNTRFLPGPFTSGFVPPGRCALYSSRHHSETFPCMS